VGASDGRAVLAGEDLTHPVPGLRPGSDAPGAVEGHAVVRAAGTGRRQLELLGCRALDEVDVGERAADGEHHGDERDNEPASCGHAVTVVAGSWGSGSGAWPRDVARRPTRRGSAVTGG